MSTYLAVFNYIPSIIIQILYIGNTVNILVIIVDMKLKIVCPMMLQFLIIDQFNI